MSTDTQQIATNAWPLFMNSRILVAGKGYWAGIQVKSRALLVLEDDGNDPEYHLYGVNPGGLAAGGKTIEAANKEFYEGLRGVTFDLADEADDFDAFQEKIRAVFNETDGYYEMRWKEALALVRSNSLDLAGAPREPGDTAASIDVIRIETPVPGDNPQRLPEHSLATPTDKKAA